MLRFSDYKENMALYLAGNNDLLCKERIEDPQCQALYKTLASNAYVRTLDLRYNRITDKGAKFMAQLIEVRSKVRGSNVGWSTRSGEYNRPGSKFRGQRSGVIVHGTTRRGEVKGQGSKVWGQQSGVKDQGATVRGQSLWHN
jgi:hypothetical protein